MRGETRALAAGTLVLAALGLFVALRLRVNTDITHFLPSGRLDPEIRIARELAAGEPSRTMVLLVEAPEGEAEAAVRGGEALEAALRAEPRVGPALAFLEGGPPADFEEAMWRLFEPRRLAFFAADPAAVAAATTPEALRVAVEDLKHKLALPISGLVSRVAPGDPTLVLPRLIERLAGRGEGLRLLDGRFVSNDGHGAVLFLGTRASSSDGSVQGPLLAGIHAAFERVARDSPVPLVLSMSGANRFAARAEAAIRADIQRVSIGSTVGLVLLFLLLFGSLRLVVMVLPIVGAGFLAGTSACLLLFGSVHGLTLAFGAAMIGVSVDYAVHFHCHQLLAPDPGGPRRTLRGIWSGLALSAATTVVGFLALAASEFPGLRELAVFAAVGISAALLATRPFLPALAGHGRPTAGSLRLARLIGAVLAPRQERRALLLLPTAAMLVAAALGLPRLRWNDDISDLNRLDPGLLAEDDSVREHVVRFDQRRLIVASGADEEAALAVDDRVAEVLEGARRDGILGSWRSLATLLPSAARQRAVAAAVRGEPELWPRLEAALTEAGFRAEGFAPFREALAAPAPEPLTFADLEASPLAGIARPFRIQLEDGVGFLGLVNEVKDEAALRARLARVEGARLIDVREVLSKAYGSYRRQMSGLLLLGFLAVFALVLVRHRRWKPSLVAYLPALLSAAGTLGILALAGVALNLLTLVALLMVVGMGVDYGVLLAEAGNEGAGLEATHLAVFVAGTSTILGFGLLAFSDQPALFSIGSTAGIGVLSCLVLAPTLSAFASRKSS